ncbi:MAG TPA: lipopolysaccharide heptosyltransferase II [Victivallales bacterium]|nr:lipopolysaccharide heptosyltransferase II [Victivallales bacterium]
MSEYNIDKLSKQHASLTVSARDWKDGILIRSPNWLGDAIMALPAIYSLYKMKPKNCGLFIAAPDNLVPLFNSFQFIDHILPLGSGHSSWSRDTLEKAIKLNAGIGFLFVNSLRSAYYFKKAHIKKVFGASNGIRNFLLKKSFKINWHTAKEYAEIHQSYKYLSMVYALGAQKWDGHYPEFNLLNESDISIEGLSSFLNSKNIMVVSPGAAYGPSKRWNLSNYESVCRAWIQDYKGKIIITGASKEIEDSNKLSANLDLENVMNVTGKTTLEELIYILKKSTVCISNDSGTMHLGSALDIKGIVIFGSTDPYSTGPLSNNWKVLLKKQPCSPCFSRECINSENNYNCLKAIKVGQVLKAVDDLLKK